MADLDVIMLSNTANDSIYQMTTETIKSLRESDGLDNVNIILLESNKESKYEYDVNTFIKPDIPFNYNAYLNIGAKYTNSKEFNDKIERSYQWAKSLDWKIVCKQWIEYFKEIYKL